MSKEQLCKISVDFNRNDDREEFPKENRFATMFAYLLEDGEVKITMAFELGRKEDDDMILEFDADELILAIFKALAYRTDFRGKADLI